MTCFPGAFGRVAVLAILTLAAERAYSAPIFITIDGPPSFIPISDGGPGDLNPHDGIIGFDQTLFFRTDGTTAVRIRGTAIYVPGTPIPGGQTGFGLRLTDFSAAIVEDTPGTQSVPLIIINVEGTFSPGVPAPDFGVVTDHIDGSITFNETVGFRAFVTDLSTWTGDPPVSAGHAEIPVINTSNNPGNVVHFSFPDITSPAASGDLDPEIVHYQLNLPRCLTHNAPCSEFDLPGSGTAIVSATPEPGTFPLLSGGGLVMLGYALRRLSTARAVRSTTLPEGRATWTLGARG